MSTQPDSTDESDSQSSFSDESDAASVQNGNSAPIQIKIKTSKM